MKNGQIFKSPLLRMVSIAILICISISAIADNNNYLPEDLSQDSLKKSETHKEKKANRKEKKKADIQTMKDLHSRFILSLNSVFASLDTRVTFKGPNNILNLSLGLEDNLGLPSNRIFIAASFMYRITPRSGLYLEYYGINRKETHTTTEEFYWKEDTIEIGSSFSAYFDTQVASAGYMLSALKDPDAFRLLF